MTEILDQREVQAFIDDRFGDRASEVTRLSGGDWSQAYALTLDGTQVVARFGSHGEDYEKDRVASGWASDELPIPTVLELDKTEVGFFALSSRARGEFLDELHGDQIRAVLPGLFRTMDAIRDMSTSQPVRATATGSRTAMAGRELGGTHCFTSLREIHLPTGPTVGELRWRLRPAAPETSTPH